MSFHSIPNSVRYRRLTFLGYPNYRVGTDGSVWSCRAKGDTKGQIGPWWRMKPGRFSKAGHVSVSLFRGDGSGKGKSFQVHHLILFAFVGPRPEGMECRHLNGIEADNRLENIRWGTRQENINDRHRLGETCKGRIYPSLRGKNHHRWNALLDEKQVLRIRRLFSEGERQTDLSRKYGVSIMVIHNIVRRKSWRHL